MSSEKLLFPFYRLEETFHLNQDACSSPNNLENEYNVS